MSTLDRIKALCDERGITISQLEKELGYGNGSLAKAKSIKAERLIEISKFLDTTMEYLLTGAAPDWQPAITDKDEKDIKKAIDAIKNQLATGTGLMYDGEPMDEESMEAVLAAIEVAERTAVLAAKKKFTPNKYRK